ncbi:putative phagocytic receptor 1b isoform X1 [Tripterygium wilfordii]|uniref:Transmembrane 9 superfamily member n=1 Tax=Tripterygium wilfordii TaxID=458696 RepID=A0A7J7C805_TRIWF|nr:putative phagocytic receptor 1b isoform X1 [Tripterygium wilfordii]
MAEKMVAMLFVAVLMLMAVDQVRSDASNHRYKEGDQVPLYANKVGPFHNPSETYRYYDLPFCLPDDLKEKSEALGEVLNGDRLVSAPYKLDFLRDKDSERVCKKTFTKEQVLQFRSAVKKDYYFQMFYDDLPIWGFLGMVDKEGKDPSDYKYYLFKHIHFDIFYNKDRVIEIYVRTDTNAVIDLTEDKEVDVEFYYAVKWKETNIPFEKRMDKYSQSSSLPHHLEIHWFSIINSCVTVLLLTGFLATILMRVLKNDFVKYADDEESAEDQEESGWKYIHGDVFRYPKYKSLFAAALGSGTQLFTLSFLCGGSTGLFIYAYCLYYYYARSEMSGFMQTSFFFGYMACICYGFFLMLGTGYEWFESCNYCSRCDFENYEAAFDTKLRSVLKLATDSELYELERILYGRSPYQVDERESLGLAEDLDERETYIAALESRFFFLAAVARSTLRGWRPYRDVLLAVRKELNVLFSSNLSTEDLEAEIFLHLAQEYSSCYFLEDWTFHHC